MEQSFVIVSVYNLIVSVFCLILYSCLPGVSIFVNGASRLFLHINRGIVVFLCSNAAKIPSAL